MSEVGVAQLRRALKQWLARVQAGDEVIVTDRGRPIARLTNVDSPTALDRLVAAGRLSPTRRGRPHARAADRVRGRGPASHYVADERDRRRT